MKSVVELPALVEDAILFVELLEEGGARQRVRMLSMTVSILCLRAKSTVSRATSGPSESAPRTNMPWLLMP
jgi:hypothetical protein